MVFRMAMIWTICGASRGVGKTHVALGICALLPNAVYAKHGCGQRKPGKPPHLFANEPDLAAFVSESHDAHEHIVVESNDWARQGIGDVIIYVDRVPWQPNVRDDIDELQIQAHLRISADASIVDWQRALTARQIDAVIRDRICALLASQRHYTTRSPKLRVCSKVWIVAGNDHPLERELAVLLREISRLGTLTAAARQAGMSARRARKLINDTEQHLEMPLVIPQTGGAGGGHSSLSLEGKRLLEIFERINREVAAYADARFAHYYSGEGSHG